MPAILNETKNAHPLSGEAGANRLGLMIYMRLGDLIDNKCPGARDLKLLCKGRGETWGGDWLQQEIGRAADKLGVPPGVVEAKPVKEFAELVVSSAATAAGSPPGSEARTTLAQATQTKRRVTAEEAMKAELAASLDEVVGFTVRQWKKRIGFSVSTIQATDTWKNLQLLRAKTKAEHAMDRSHNGRRRDRK